MNFKPDLKSLFKSPQSQFMISVGWKVMASSLIIHLFVTYSLIQQLRFNFLFFKTQSNISVLELETFFGFVASEALDILLPIFIFHIILFLTGCYIGRILLRPFATIAQYSEKAIDNMNAIYHPEAYSNYNLLTRFSEFFFVYLRECRIKKHLVSQSIPPQFSKIHKPSRDIVYFIHFSFLLVIVGVITLISASVVIDTLLANVIELAIRQLPNAQNYKMFFLGQAEIFNDIFILIALLIVFFYGGLAIHLYDKMSGAAFGIFSTMRAYMKGNHSSRVHLLGFSYVREYTRKLNSFLNHIERELEKDKE